MTEAEPRRPEPVVVAEPIRLAEVVHFAFDQHELSPQSRELLTEIAGVLGQHPEVSITLAGHTDSRGSRGYNEALAHRRIMSVERFLIQAGINAVRMTRQTLGELEPKVVAQTEQGHARNRRVVLIYQAPTSLDMEAFYHELDLQVLRGTR